MHSRTPTNNSPPPPRGRGNKTQGKSRRTKDWLNDYLQYTKNTEPPTSFHMWAGISVLSSCLQRRVYMRWGHETIYPNQYIVLVGPSGQSRKGVAIGIARDLMHQVRVQITAERITREALYKFMKDATIAFTDKSTGKYKFQCPITCVAEELQVFLGQRNVEFLAELTNWYDSRDEWTYETKWSGVDKITGMCVNILAGTAPDWLPSILPAEAVGGGFTSRIVFVVEDSKSKTVEDPNAFRDDLKIRDNLMYDLEQIMLMTGEMRFDEDALETYKVWYRGEDEKFKRGIQELVDPRLAGYNSRRATHVKKICMAVSAARGSDMLITKVDFQRALKLMQDTEKKMPRVFTGLGKARFSEATEDILYLLSKERVVKRSAILRRFYTKIDTFVMDSVEKMLEEMGVIKIARTPGLSDKIYTYIGDPDDPSLAIGDDD